MRDLKTISCGLSKFQIPSNSLISGADNYIHCIDRKHGKLLRFKETSPTKAESILPQEKVVETSEVLKTSQCFQAVNGCGGFHFVSTPTNLYSYQYGDPEEVQLC